MAAPHPHTPAAQTSDRAEGPTGSDSPPASAPTSPSASPAGGRETGLDIVRGLAVLGTFGTNVWLFTHPAGMLGSLVDPRAGIDRAAGTVLYELAAGLPNGKFLALLMMVFGMGVTIQFASWDRRRPHRAARRGWLRSYAPRALVLLLDGAANFVLVAEFDVLMGYAFTGFVTAALIAGSPRTVRIWAWCAGIVHVLGMLLLAGVLLSPAGATGGADANSPADPTAAAAAVHQHGSFVDLALFRLENAAVFRAEILLTLALGLCLFLVGAHLFDRGLFAPHGAVLRRRLMLVGACALPVDLALGFADFAPGVLLQRYLTAPVVALGLLGLIAHLSRTPLARSAPGRWAATVGRMSLSVYVGQNLLAGALLYGWGLGLAGRFPDQRVLLTLATLVVVIAAMVVFAHLWQTTAVRGAGRRGPLESLTRTLTRRTP